MAYWLLKTEPDEYSIDDLARQGKAEWDGVMNPVALRNLRSMRPGDKAFIYHTGGERRVVGTAEIASEPYPDPNRNDPKIVWVDVAFVSKLPAPVTLKQMKEDPAFEGWILLRVPRLSVAPVPENLWKRILDLAASG